MVFSGSSRWTRHPKYFRPLDRSLDVPIWFELLWTTLDIYQPLPHILAKKKEDTDSRPPLGLFVSPDADLSRRGGRGDEHPPVTRAPVAPSFPSLPCGGLEAGPQRHRLTAGHPCGATVSSGYGGAPPVRPAGCRPRPRHGVSRALRAGPSGGWRRGCSPTQAPRNPRFLFSQTRPSVLGSGVVVPSMTARAPTRAGLRRSRTSDGRGSSL